MPPELIGTWTTNDPRYTGISFEITVSSITLLTAEGGSQTYGISNFKKGSGDGKHMSYSFDGDRDGQRQQFAFFYTPIAGGELRFRNQIAIRWSKANGSNP